RATADRALTRFAKGDSFVAEGYVRTFQVVRDGEAIQREEFVAKKIGHDLARTNYSVDRTHRTGSDIEVEHKAAAAHTSSRR
ncbi:MAG: single-stranded DNA-binding protein, partial [Kineosporiaceae bacterium]|nr:single-stranded DNA-binding protein [Aeromicrobium sp.]